MSAFHTHVSVVIWITLISVSITQYRYVAHSVSPLLLIYQRDSLAYNTYAEGVGTAPAFITHTSVTIWIIIESVSVAQSQYVIPSLSSPIFNNGTHPTSMMSLGSMMLKSESHVFVEMIGELFVHHVFFHSFKSQDVKVLVCLYFKFTFSLLFVL